MIDKSIFLKTTINIVEGSELTAITRLLEEEVRNKMLQTKAGYDHINITRLTCGWIVSPDLSRSSNSNLVINNNSQCHFQPGIRLLQ